ncbi:glycerol-3-phosphate acyltransferase [Caldalkalibacillus salinus]|uniref:glycerol-3-phosphate acyltransferase n=1 Tax=Caldalkalibacillus salinus TaxID=2803787 RepID=UPI001924F69A|nr:glycerol-3-phosphate acyltransferase [Caldalkalibacillus salinus]
MTFFLFCVIAYIIGSIPVGKIVAKYKGIDIQEKGTGNIGASNTYLVLGKKAGMFVLISDVGKAFFMMQLSLYMLPIGQAIVSGMFLLMGNLRSMFLKFSGGKGVATVLGIFLATEPIAALVCVAFWGVTTIFIKYISLMSIVGSLAVPFTYYRYDHDLFTAGCAFLMCVLVLLKHKTHFQLKTRGTEVQKA